MLEEKAGPSSEAFQKIVEEVAKTIKETVTASENENADTDSGSSETTEDETVDEGLHISPNAVFAYTRDEWNAFTFTVLTNASEQTVYIWDFGDGVTSSKPTVQHVYNTSGAFPVKLTTTDESGIVSSESTTVLVPFFHLKNRLVLASVVLLMLLLLVGIASFVRLGKKTSPHA